MKHYIAQITPNKTISSNMLETYVHTITLTVGLIAIITLLWKIASFMQVLSISIDLLKKDVQELETVIRRLSKRYENIHFFLIRQHGIETVNKNLRTEEDENE